MKKSLTILIIILILIIPFLHARKDNSLDNKNFNIYLEEAGEYNLSGLSSFPTAGYKLNTEESSCTGGGTVSQNSANHKISLNFDSSEKCNLYFDDYTAAGKIMGLAYGKDKSSTAAFTGNAGNKYALVFNGVVKSYDGSSSCTTYLENYDFIFGSNATGSCALNSTTNKYDLTLTGNSGDGGYYYTQESDCQAVLNKYGFANTTCSKVQITSSCSTLAYDGTTDNNLRYVGSNPCNYVDFYGQEWRIIGVMNNVDNGTGKLERRLKLIKSDSLGSFVIDSDVASVNNGWGTNDWPASHLREELNTDYLNTTPSGSTSWYNGKENQKTGTYFYFWGLNDDRLGEISDAVWTLGGRDNAENGASAFYTAERGTRTYSSIQTCSDTDCPRSTTWTGKVALMYASDYGFSVGGSARNTCLSTNLYNYTTNNCYSNSRLFDDTTAQHTLTNRSASPIDFFRIDITGYIGYGVASNAVRPVVYLNADSMFVAAGNGTKEYPYSFDFIDY